MSAATLHAAVVRDVQLDTVAAALRTALSEAPLEITDPDGTAIVLTTVSLPAPVHSEVVDALVDRLYDAGWRRVVVGSVVRIRDRDRGLTDFATLAAQAGVHGTTSAGNPYRVADLHDDLIAADVPDSSVLSGQLVSAEWVNAGLRVVVARNVTDLADGYVGCLDALGMVAYPVAGAAGGDIAADILEHLPPQVCVVDALVSSHGFAGADIAKPIETRTLLVADDALLVDVLTARLQDVDPAVSRPVRTALDRRGLPTDVTVAGDLTPFRGWQCAPTLARAALQEAGTSVERFVSTALTPVDVAAPPDSVASALQQAIAPYTPYLDAPGFREWADWALAWTSYTLAAAGSQTKAWSTVFAADRLDRVEVPLGFDPDDYSAADYATVAADAAGFERYLAGVPATEDGLSWAMLDRAVVFEISREVRAPFADFVERVDVAQGISLMADYIGGRVVVLDRDDEGRPVRQAERNLYLTQPNYLAFWGGQPIDVCKIETVSYSDTEHRLAWRTIASPNGSATYDDGAMTFADAGPGRTRITVSGRQLFTLPPFWAAADLDRFPQYKAPLVEDAYRQFFAATFDNLEACYEGREFRVGRPPADPARPLPTEVLTGLVSSAAKKLADPATLNAAHETDAEGFRHFSGSATAAVEAPRWASAWQQIVSEYLTAAAGDWARLVQR